MIHVALKLRDNTLNHPFPQTVNDANDVLTWMADSVYVFLRLLLREQSTLNEETYKKLM